MPRVLDVKSTSALILTTSFPLGKNSSAGIFVYDQCRQLVKNGVEVTVLAPHHHGALRVENVTGIVVQRFRYFFPSRFQRVCYGAGIATNLKRFMLAKIQMPFLIMAFLLAACREVKKKNIVHCHWSIAGAVGVIVGKIFKKPVLLTMHGAEIFVLGKHWLVNFAVRNADYVIFNSSYTAEKTRKLIPISNYSIIPLSVDNDRFRYLANTTIREKYGIKKNTFLVLSIGRLVVRKGIEFLVDAIDKVVRNEGREDIHLIIGGDGPLKKSFEKLISEKGLELYITLAGFIDEKDLPELYSESDVFVLPAIVDLHGDTEGLGMVLLEAGACKTPVIASNVGGIVDIVKDGENGLLVPEKDSSAIAEAILTLMDNQDLRLKMGEKSQLIFQEQFSEDVLIQHMIQVYQDLLKGAS
jgi:glycosyltransferase involved in cell wall biosynthesis